MADEFAAPGSTTPAAGHRADDQVVFDVNGHQRRLRVDADETLLTTLRETFGLTSVRGTCGIGICGSCTVLVDGRAVSSCIMLTRQVGGRGVTTADGLVDGDRLDEVQEAFVDATAYQCSFCIPGMTMAVRACLDEHPDASLEQVREYLAGNLCRCGTYPQILDAVRRLLGDGPVPSETGGADGDGRAGDGDAPDADGDAQDGVREVGDTSDGAAAGEDGDTGEDVSAG